MANDEDVHEVELTFNHSTAGLSFRTDGKLQGLADLHLNLRRLKVRRALQRASRYQNL